MLEFAQNHWTLLSASRCLLICFTKNDCLGIESERIWGRYFSALSVLKHPICSPDGFNPCFLAWVNTATMAAYSVYG